MPPVDSIRTSDAQTPENVSANESIIRNSSTTNPIIASNPATATRLAHVMILDPDFIAKLTPFLDVEATCKLAHTSRQLYRLVTEYSKIRKHKLVFWCDDREKRHFGVETFFRRNGHYLDGRIEVVLPCDRRCGIWLPLTNGVNTRMQVFAPSTEKGVLVLQMMQDIPTREEHKEVLVQARELRRFPWHVRDFNANALLVVSESARNFEPSMAPKLERLHVVGDPEGFLVKITPNQLRHLTFSRLDPGKDLRKILRKQKQLVHIGGKLSVDNFFSAMPPSVQEVSMLSWSTADLAQVSETRQVNNIRAVSLTLKDDWLEGGAAVKAAFDGTIGYQLAHCFPKATTISLGFVCTCPDSHCLENRGEDFEAILSGKCREAYGGKGVEFEVSLDWVAPWHPDWHVPDWDIPDLDCLMEETDSESANDQ